MASLYPGRMSALSLMCSRARLAANKALLPRSKLSPDIGKNPMIYNGYLGSASDTPTVDELPHVSVVSPEMVVSGGEAEVARPLCGVVINWTPDNPDVIVSVTTPPVYCGMLTATAVILSDVGAQAVIVRGSLVEFTSWPLVVIVPRRSTINTQKYLILSNLSKKGMSDSNRLGVLSQE